MMTPKEKLELEKQGMLADCEERIKNLKKDMERKEKERLEDLAMDKDQLAYLELKKAMYK